MHKFAQTAARWTLKASAIHNLTIISVATAASLSWLDIYHPNASVHDCLSNIDIFKSRTLPAHKLKMIMGHRTFVKTVFFVSVVPFSQLPTSHGEEKQQKKKKKSDKPLCARPMNQFRKRSNFSSTTAARFNGPFFFLLIFFFHLCAFDGEELHISAVWITLDGNEKNSNLF